MPNALEADTGISKGFAAAEPGKPVAKSGDAVVGGGSRIVGHATLEDGSNVPLTADVAESIWNAAIAEKEARAAAMPTEADALRQFFDAASRLAELGWMQPCYAIRHGECDTIQIGSSGIHRAAYSGEWPDGYWWLRDDIDNIDPPLCKPVERKPIFPPQEAPTS